MVLAQTCTALGQNATTAFPVCGVDTFFQQSVGICGNRIMVTKGCGNAPYSDKNPYWYKFTCFQTGTLGFTITPLDLFEDYDWQLFDITGLSNIDAIYTNVNLIVASNWSGDKGITGTNANSANLFVCGGTGQPLFSAMPMLQKNHEYLLLISHFEDSQSGYKLSFTGGSAVITDPAPPALSTANAPCDGSIMTVKLNKKMKCSSLAGNGSDFTINTNAAQIIAARGVGCNGGFDLDSVVLTLNNPIPAGTYQLTMQRSPLDGNTLLDNCRNEVPVGNTVNVTIYPLYPTPLDSVVPIQVCKPTSATLVFQKPMQCSSIAADGSDFVVNGPSTVSVAQAKGIGCTYDSVLGLSLTKNIEIVFQSPVYQGGTYSISLKQGTDNNTLLNNCGAASPIQTLLPLYIKQSVRPEFEHQQHTSCTHDSLFLKHDGNSNTHYWQWTIDFSLKSNLQNPVFLFPNSGRKNIKLLVSNKECTDSSIQQIELVMDTLAAQFNYPPFVCPEDAAVFTDQSIGNIVSWRWNTGNGQVWQTQQIAPQKYPPTPRGQVISYPVQLIVTNKANCSDTVLQHVQVPANCYIAVPTAFTPNNDGNNDYLYPLNAYKAQHLLFNVYNRYGQLIFTTTDWTKKWNGSYQGVAQLAGTYIWTLNYWDTNTNQWIHQKGTTVLVR